MVERLVVGAIDEVRADVAEFDGHVIKRCGDTAGADIVGVFGCPATEASRQGRVQMGVIMLTNVRSLTFSLSHVWPRTCENVECGRGYR